MDETLTARARGALLGQACGDAFGMPNSFLKSPVWRTNMEPGPDHSPYHAGYRPGRITDDTEQAVALSIAYVSSQDRLEPSKAAKEILRWLDAVGGLECLAVGPSTKRAAANIMNGVPLEQAGTLGVTNGAPMRVSVVGVWAALSNISEDSLLDDVVAACLPTHNTSVAISGAAAIAGATYAGVQGAEWAEARDFAIHLSRRGQGCGNWIYAPSVADRIESGCTLVAGLDDTETIEMVSKVVGMGEPTQESVPAAFVLANHVNADPHRAILLAGNCQGDTDTVAAMAGAIAGACSGADSIPHDWISAVVAESGLDVDAWISMLAQKSLRQVVTTY